MADIRVLTQREHVLARSDMYIGSCTPQDVDYVAWEDTGEKKDALCASKRTAPGCVPALLHLFDEVLVNAVDNSTRCTEQKKISVVIDRATGEIQVYNDGATIPVIKHADTDKYTPTITMSTFLSGSNLDDNHERTWGGRFGIGVKAVNAWSTRFHVMCCDAVNHKKFEQTWTDNMSVASPPTVTRYAAKTSSTTVTFTPDYTRLGVSPATEGGNVLDDGTYGALVSRVYDACVCTRPNLHVSLNGTRLGLRTLQQYALALGGEAPFANDVVKGEEGDDAVFRVCACARADSAEPAVVAFVNGIRCCAGSHVDMAWRAIVAAVASKGKTNIRLPHVRSETIFVLDARIPNPTFDSQMKNTLSTSVKNFRFTWQPSSAFCNALSRVAERAARNARGAEQRSLEKSSKTSTRGLVHVDKLDDALCAGARGEDCTLLVTEGDSAKAFAVAGLSVVGRERFGVYALRGKPMNVRNYSDKKVVENEQCVALMKILGLQWNALVDADTPLRYKRVVILSDQDVDGSHICGLLLNFFQCNWPSLLDAYPDFLLRFVTPLVRVTLPCGGGTAGNDLFFFSEVEHEAWMREMDGMPTGRSKYFKGLGTSTSAMAREYFAQWDAHTIRLQRSSECVRALDLFFDNGPKAAAARKAYLQDEYDAKAYVDYAQDATTWTTFLKNDMSHYSAEDNVRSIPSAIDGLKEAQRKVLYAFFTRKGGAEVKVAQAMAFCAEATAYHHGEQSMGETIVGLAQDHVGTNNVALLAPNGQFGSRLFKPNTHAAFRYIFTQLDPVARCLYPEADDAVLTYRVDDGTKIEPTRYVPLIPTVLINGAHGIGSGFSTHVPSFRPEDVLDATLAWIATARNDADASLALVAWHRHFTGEVDEPSEGTFRTQGTFEVVAGAKRVEIHITELPVGKWTEDYKSMVRDTMMVDGCGGTPTRFVTDLKDLSTEHAVHIVLYTTEELLPTDVSAATLKLIATESTSNMHLFDADGKIRRYASVADVVHEHAVARLRTYSERLAYQVAEAERRSELAQHKAAYIRLVRDGTIDLVGSADDAALCAQMAAHDLPSVPALLDLPNRAFTEARAAKQDEEAAALARKVESLRATDVYELWTKELETLRVALFDYAQRKEAARTEATHTQREKRARGKGRATGGKRIKKA